MRRRPLACRSQARLSGKAAESPVGRAVGLKRHLNGRLAALSHLGDSRCRLAWTDAIRGTTNAPTDASVMAHNGDETIFIGPAGPSDAREGYPWRWVVSYGGERRSGACASRAQAQAEAAAVLELLKRG